jgi:hypothetical protein
MLLPHKSSVNDLFIGDDNDLLQPWSAGANKSNGSVGICLCIRRGNTYSSGINDHYTRVFPVCRLASRTWRSKARALADCKVLNSALKRRPTAVTSSASPPGTLRPLSKTCMSNRSANVSAIAISRGNGSLLGLMFLALLTFRWVATRTRSAGEVGCNQCLAVKKVLRHGPV